MEMVTMNVNSNVIDVISYISVTLEQTTTPLDKSDYDDEDVLARWQRDDSHDVRLCQYDGKLGVFIRHYYLDDDDNERKMLPIIGNYAYHHIPWVIGVWPDDFEDFGDSEGLR